MLSTATVQRFHPAWTHWTFRSSLVGKTNKYTSGPGNRSRPSMDSCPRLRVVSTAPRFQNQEIWLQDLSLTTLLFYYLTQSDMDVNSGWAGKWYTSSLWLLTGSLSHFQWANQEWWCTVFIVQNRTRSQMGAENVVLPTFMMQIHCAANWSFHTAPSPFSEKEG